MVEMFSVSSSNVAEVGYDKQSSQLYVRFNNGGLYVYDGVPFNEFEYLKNASSVGTYLAQNIKNRYPYRKI
ncbi:KTSC domain-containing protein [Methanogenium cariaci]|jgi:KTSC domain-containing protein